MNEIASPYLLATKPRHRRTVALHLARRPRAEVLSVIKQSVHLADHVGVVEAGYCPGLIVFSLRGEGYHRLDALRDLIEGHNVAFDVVVLVLVHHSCSDRLILTGRVGNFQNGPVRAVYSVFKSV